MAWPKGKPRPEGAGRKKGTPNRSSLSLEEKCAARGIDVFELLLEYVIEECPRELRFKAIQELCSYLYPKRKAIEHSGEISNPYLAMEFTELEKLVKEKIKKK